MASPRVEHACRRYEAVRWKKLTEEERFWAKIDRSEYAPGGCWPWTACKSMLFQASAGTVRAITFLLSLQGIKFSKRIYTYNLCHTARCLQPAHLYVEVDEDRFWSQVDRSQYSPGGCWPWIGCKWRNGYAQFWLNRKLEKAHRISFLWAGGKFTKEKPLGLHICVGNRACVNPSHIYAGNQKQNISDAIRAGTFDPDRLVYDELEKTHCIHGHPLSGENLLPSGLKLGIRLCRSCSRNKHRRHKMRRKRLANA